MEGLGVWQPTPAGYLNSTTAFFYPRPEITGENLTLQQVYVSPQGSDDPSNNGVITSPFATISAALFYVTTVSVVFPTPLSAPICIFVAPGLYEGGFTVPDNVYLIGPANSPEPVVIFGNIFVSPSSSSADIILQNLTLEGVTVAGAFFDSNLKMRNCKLETNSIFSALTLAPGDLLVNITVVATECVFSATNVANVSLISGNTSERNNLTLDNCQLNTVAPEGVLIDMTGSLAVKNSSLINTAVGTILGPLILITSGASLTPVVSLEGSVLRYDDLQTDVGGNKLALKFNAITQPITARMTNCTISVHLGLGGGDIVRNIGASVVTLSQSANSCLLDGKTIDGFNITLPNVAFLQDSPEGPPLPIYQATYYKSANQNLTSGATDITFDLSGAWNNDNGYITHTDGTTAFTVVEAGLYQLEWFAAVVANGAAWTTATNKSVSIDITRAPGTEQVVITDSALIATGSNYNQTISSTFNLEAGDVINCRIVNTFTGGPPQAFAVANTIDLNTWFSWRYVSSGGGGGGGAGVTSLAGLTGAVTFSSPGATIGIVPNGQDIELTNLGIVSLDGLVGLVTLSSPDSSINIGNVGNAITLQTLPPVTPPPSVQATTTTALTPGNVNTLYILTSGATQDFTTAGLGVGDGGKVWYVKNASAADIDIQENGVAIAGQTDTIHQGTGSSNSSIQVLYWTGAVLTMY